MIVDTKYLREEIIKIWPNLKPQDIIPWDPIYYLISEKTVGDLIKKSDVSEMDFIPDFNDCDNFALQFQAEVRRKRYFAYKKAQEMGEIPEELRYPVAMAIAWGTMWRGINKNHVANLFVCDEGIYLSDLTPMENRHWKANPNNDRILRVDFK